MTYKEALNQDIKLSPIQAKNDLERYLLREEKPIPKAVAMGMQALEKQIPKKPSNMRRIGSSFDMSTGMGLSYFEGLCEVCKTSNTNWRAKEKITYCEKCGQALDWSDTE